MFPRGRGRPDNQSTLLHYAESPGERKFTVGERLHETERTLSHVQMISHLKGDFPGDENDRPEKKTEKGDEKIGTDGGSVRGGRG